MSPDPSPETNQLEKNVFSREPFANRCGNSGPLSAFECLIAEVPMGIFTKDIKTMEDLFLHGLQDIYYAKKKITKALPKMIEMATNTNGLDG